MEENLVRLLATSATIVGLAVMGVITIHLASRRALGWAQGLDRLAGGRRQQLVTLIQITRWLANIGLLVAAVMMLLSTFGIDITPLLASVGVAGLAVSLGAQSLIKDLIGGVLILVENQFAVGDTIQVGSASGAVEQITLRTTRLRAVNGDLYVVPNGEVRILANQTRDWSRVQVDLGVAYEQDLDRVLQVLESSVAGFAEAPEMGSRLLEPPSVLGIVSLGDSAAIVRVAVKTQPGEQWAVGRELRRFLLAVCEREGVELPYPRQEVWVHGPAEGARHERVG